MLTHEALKTRQRAIRHTFPEGLGLRVHRALSWLNRADQETEDDDARFIFGHLEKPHPSHTPSGKIRFI